MRRGAASHVDRLYHGPSQSSADTASALTELVRGATAVHEVTRAITEEWPSKLEGECVALLLGDQRDGDRLVLDGGVAWLEGEPRPAGMRLRGLLPPRVLSVVQR